MGLEISDEILQSAHLSADELRREIALLLFQQDRLTLGQASALAGMSQFDFQQLLADRQIPLHYGVADFDEDLKTIEALGNP